ncbi:unnamed protein product [Dovyalis caffra]|uniref:Prolamin-like domain-containing protein n=1 Tax=Dovyalis caffra TaxID=77055 RepID=A0AAV1R1Q5_9ROSI|nr:unnamed protein product [Dovyalis caffra]
MALVALVSVFMGTSGLVGRVIATYEECVPKLGKYLKDCSIKLGDKCGARNFSSLIGNYTPSIGCCNELVTTGKNCHEEFTKFLISKEPQENPTKISTKSLNVWNDCVGVVAQAPYTASEESMPEA